MQGNVETFIKRYGVFYSVLSIMALVFLWANPLMRGWLFFALVGLMPYVVFPISFILLGFVFMNRKPQFLKVVLIVSGIQIVLRFLMDYSRTFFVLCGFPSLFSQLKLIPAGLAIIVFIALVLYLRKRWFPMWGLIVVAGVYAVSEVTYTTMQIAEGVSRGRGFISLFSYTVESSLPSLFILVGLFVVCLYEERIPHFKNETPS